MPDRVLSFREVCETFAISRSTVHRLLSLGEFPQGFRLGRQRRWSEGAISTWMKSREQPAEESGPRGRKR